MIINTIQRKGQDRTHGFRARTRAPRSRLPSPAERIRTSPTCECTRPVAFEEYGLGKMDPTRRCLGNLNSILLIDPRGVQVCIVIMHMVP
jgi:hypothetical protein